MSDRKSQPVALSHFGICASDLERAASFYRNAFGFAELFRSRSGDEVAPIAELAEVDLDSVFLGIDGVRVELMEYRRPGHVGSAERRPMNQLGLTHMALHVAAIDPVIERVERWGGTVHAHTRTRFEGDGGERFEIVFCTDPDGTRIELVCRRPA